VILVLYFLEKTYRCYANTVFLGANFFENHHLIKVYAGGAGELYGYLTWLV